MKTLRPRSLRPACLALISAGMAVLSFAGSAHLAWAADPMQVSVSYADLNMESAACLRSLYGRLQSAARRVCAPLDDGRQSSRNLPFVRCYDSALSSAVAQINKPVLTAMHNSRRQPAGG